MPTPFSHLHLANDLLRDPDLSPEARSLLHTHRPDFLLGSIVADARRTPDADREETHFYRYDKPMPDHPWRVMLAQYPTLKQPRTAGHQAFVAGYVAHLAVDEYWSRYMLKPHFAEGDWGESLRARFFVLHLLLIYMDERDEARLPDDNPADLRRAHPSDWLPFLPDAIINEWGEYIASQIEGDSETVDIFSRRIGRAPDQLRALVDSPDTMHDLLWQHLPLATLHDIEQHYYTFARQQMERFITEFISAG